MKTAEELWQKYSEETEAFNGETVKEMNLDIFITALAEHDKEIISLINGYLQDSDEIIKPQTYRILTELKEKILESKN